MLVLGGGMSHLGGQPRGSPWIVSRPFEFSRFVIEVSGGLAYQEGCRDREGAREREGRVKEDRSAFQLRSPAAWATPE